MIKSFFISLMTLAFFTFQMEADDYKITHLDKEGIRIGNRTRHVGDIFNDKEPIHWSSKVKSFRAKNLTTSKLRQFSQSREASKGNKSPQDYFTNLTGLAGRNPFNLSELGEWLTDTFVLETQIVIPVDVKTDDNHYFVLIQKVGEEEKSHRLPDSSGKIVIDRSLFEGEESDTITVAVEYVNTVRQSAYRLTDNMQIIVWNETEEINSERREE